MQHEEFVFLESPVISDPWPHTIIKNFFSESNKNIIKEFFNNNVPKKELIKDKSKVKVTTVSNIIQLAKTRNFSINRADNHNCYVTLTNEMLIKYPVLTDIVNIFKNPVIIDRICKERNDEKIKQSILRIQFIRDVTGYTIKPHPDSERKLFTFQSYFPNNNENLGTNLYDQDISFVKSIPYEENTAYWFIPRQEKPITWHGFESKNITSTRDSVMVNYFTQESNEEGIRL